MKKKLRQIAIDLFFLFDSTDENLSYEKKRDLSGFIHEISEGDYLYELINGSNVDQETKEKADRIITNLSDFGFVFGFALGQMLETPYPEAQKDIEAIKKVIREKALLPYLPREKKGGLK